MISEQEVKCDITKPFGTSPFWERLFNRFATGDIIRFPHFYGKLIAIFYNSYKMSDEQIHVQIISGWGKKVGETVKITEFLLREEQWREAELVRPCEDFKNLFGVMTWWRGLSSKQRKDLRF